MSAPTPMAPDLDPDVDADHEALCVDAWSAAGAPAAEPSARPPSAALLGAEHRRPPGLGGTLGLVALHYWGRVGQRLARGDGPGAQRASSNALTWGVTGLTVGVVTLFGLLV